jgi:PIN domain nuclease of toxin-antitoxin system
MIYADTHVVAWLYAGRADLIPSRARASLDNQPVLVSPMVALELQYLFETGRTSAPAQRVLEAIPFDRIIVAQAALRRAPLVSADTTIRANYNRAVWGR